MLIPSIKNTLNELCNLLQQLSDQQYSRQVPELSNASIGEHTRHIIEMFQCLKDCYEAGFVDYDARKRDVLMQTSTSYAVKMIDEIANNLVLENKNLFLKQILDGRQIQIETNYNRELLYNLEHTTHHQALIKVALLKIDNIYVDSNFGVANSTISYRNQCAQ